MRRILVIAASVIVLAGAGLAGYYYFFQKGPGLSVSQTPGASLPSAGSATSALPPVANAAITPGSLSATRMNARLVRISAGPVVPGEAVVNITASSTAASSSPDVSIEYIERQSGNIFSYLVHAGTLTRTSNRTLPGIESASWLPDGSVAFVRYLSDDMSTVETYALDAGGSGGFFLPQGLSDIAVAQAGILELAEGTNGSVATLVHTDGTNSKNLFTSALSSLRASFAGKSQYIAFTKPAQSLPGYLFLVDSAGNFSRLAGPASGLVALASPSGGSVLVSSAQGGTMRLSLLDVATRKTTVLPVATIADKCVWAADGSVAYCAVPVAPSPDYSYPDDWYQGAVHFSDRIWKIDVGGRYAQLVFDPSTNGVGALDAEALAVDPADTTLVFINKNDGSLWSYGL